MSKDQIRHEIINLQKTLRLLERAFDEEDWTKCESEERNEKWLKSQSILAGIGHCRRVLQNVTPADYDYGLGDRISLSGKQFHDGAYLLLDRLEGEIAEINQNLQPRPRRPVSLLSTLPRPSLPLGEISLGEDDEPSRDEPLIPVDESEREELDDGPLSETLMRVSAEYNTLPSRHSNPAATLLPPSLPSSTEEARTSSASIHNPLQTSTLLHEDLSSQLAQMAVQLRRNAELFSDSLANDEGALKATQERVERNYEDVTKERTRLRDHSSKSWYTTYFVFLTIMAVILAFFMTFFVIRIT